MRDVHDHLARAAGLIGSYREQLSSLLDLYLTEVSNRINDVMKRLTAIATVFLPLTFLTGFFGMNFGWLVDHITPLWTFLVFGVGLLVGSTAPGPTDGGPSKSSFAAGEAPRLAYGVRATAASGVATRKLKLSCR